MITANTILSHIDNRADTITLDETARHRRRMKMVSDNGISFLLDLPDARLLRHGEAIRLEDGRLIEVIAKPEPLYGVYARDPNHLLGVAWQLGNRHLPTQILGDHLRIRRDQVIGKMLVGLGAQLEEIEARFDPEGGAYGGHSHPLDGDKHD